MARRQIDVLVELQELDQKLSRKEQCLQELRQRLTAIRSEIEDTEQKKVAQQEKVQGLEAALRDLEGRRKLAEDEIKDKRVRLARVRNERERLAVEREIGVAQEQKEKLEESAQPLREQRKHAKEGLVQIEDRLEELQKEERKVRCQIVALEREVRPMREERVGLVRCLDPTLLSRYERIFAKCGRLAVVQIQQRTCKGCHMRLPPQLCNQIQSSELQRSETIYYCPHCTRITYWPKSAEEEPTA